ncbi:hypothetical protein OOU_Y34scaffold01162g1 [Pyricularia oryzae Y34]|uniref:Uncharacterized protein n=1 Tax=Pyricularia oryzae (strain Y34) TaxID=1143189 RepID=A0AA97NLN3_PYRO3|nr:hypothetical protein OOU_Y34scaffold01162g1 [Pyricularia oryzae Y34]
MTDKPQQGLPPEQCQTAFWFIDPRQFSWEFCSIDNATQHPYMAARSYHRVVDLTSMSRHLLWNTRTAICWFRIPPSSLIGYKQQLATIFSRPHGFDSPRPSTSANIVGVMESEFRTPRFKAAARRSPSRTHARRCNSNSDLSGWPRSATGAKEVD